MATAAASVREATPSLARMLATWVLGGARADEERLGDLGVGAAGDQQAQHLQLARRQAGGRARVSRGCAVDCRRPRPAHAVASATASSERQRPAGLPGGGEGRVASAARAAARRARRLPGAAATKTGPSASPQRRGRPEQPGRRAPPARTPSASGRHAGQPVRQSSPGSAELPPQRAGSQRTGPRPAQSRAAAQVDQAEACRGNVPCPSGSSRRRCSASASFSSAVARADIALSAGRPAPRSCSAQGDPVVAESSAATPAPPRAAARPGRSRPGQSPPSRARTERMRARAAGRPGLRRRASLARPARSARRSRPAAATMRRRPSSAWARTRAATSAPRRPSARSSQPRPSRRSTARPARTATRLAGQPQPGSASPVSSSQARAARRLACSASAGPARRPASGPSNDRGRLRSASARYQAACASRRRRLLAAGRQLLQPELADRLQHHDSAARRPTRSCLPQQALVDQRGDAIEDVEGEIPRRAGHRLGRLQRAAADEDRQPPEERLLLRRRAGRSSRRSRRASSAAAPAGRAPRRSAAAAAAPAGRSSAAGGRSVHPRGRQLDRQRQPVQAAADLGHGRGVRRGQREVGPGRLRPRDEEPHRRGLGQPRPRRRDRRARAAPAAARRRSRSPRGAAARGW